MVGHEAISSRDSTILNASDSSSYPIQSDLEIR
jgi:hypothetical protein